MTCWIPHQEREGVVCPSITSGTYGFNWRHMIKDTFSSPTSGVRMATVQRPADILIAVDVHTADLASGKENSTGDLCQLPEVRPALMVEPLQPQDLWPPL